MKKVLLTYGYNLKALNDLIKKRLKLKGGKTNDL